MPSRSKAQQRLMQAAAHGADFAKARELAARLTPQQLRDFGRGSMAGKPGHVPAKKAR
jgi:hypothetical protein